MFEHGAESMRKAHKAWKAGNHKKEKLLLEDKDFFLGLYQVMKKLAAGRVAGRETSVELPWE